MGLYADLSTDLGEAFDGDLSDAVNIATIYKLDRDINHFDAATGRFEAQKTSYTVRGIKLERKIYTSDSEIEPYDFEFLVLDADLTNKEISIGDLLEFSGEQSSIVNLELDPISVSWTFKCKFDHKVD